MNNTWVGHRRAANTPLSSAVCGLFFLFHGFLTRSLTLKGFVDARERQTGVPKFEDDVSAC
jgi:hypothetical protein